MIKCAYIYFLIYKQDMLDRRVEKSYNLIPCLVPHGSSN